MSNEANINGENNVILQEIKDSVIYICINNEYKPFESFKSFKSFLKEKEIDKIKYNGKKIDISKINHKEQLIAQIDTIGFRLKIPVIDIYLSYKKLAFFIISVISIFLIYKEVLEYQRQIRLLEYAKKSGEFKCYKKYINIYPEGYFAQEVKDSLKIKYILITGNWIADDESTYKFKSDNKFQGYVKYDDSDEINKMETWRLESNAQTLILLSGNSNNVLKFEILEITDSFLKLDKINLKRIY